MKVFIFFVVILFAIINIVAIRAADPNAEFKKADLNHDGNLDNPEVRKLVEALLKTCPQQSLGSKNVDRVTENIFSRADTNKDKKINRDEYKKHQDAFHDCKQ